MPAPQAQKQMKMNLLMPYASCLMPIFHPKLLQIDLYPHRNQDKPNLPEDPQKPYLPPPRYRDHLLPDHTHNHKLYIAIFALHFPPHF
jgi:hypothetical protein